MWKSLFRHSVCPKALATLALAIAGAAGAVFAASSAAPARTAKPQRIVSLNLCSDQLVLALADRSQIAGLTRNATNADMSAMAAQAKGLRILGTSAEEILEIDPDLVIGMPVRRSAAIGALAGQNYRIVDLKSADTLEQIYASIRETAAAVGHPDRGETMIAGMQRDLARIRKVGGGKVAVYYQRRGYVTGTGTLIDDLMTHLGLVNLSGKLGKSSLAQVGLEEMVAAQPDYIIVESATNRVTDQGTEMLHHPALKNIPRIAIPQAWTVCGSAAYVLAAQGIERQIVARRKLARGAH